ncbi:thiamine pyrophosphate-binding protein [Nocardia sp. CDC159]|uniref:acetolactate synthase n=1 Tax=Nocardia pulmonis TaxID=2951408 RepID=A0A9X2J074_9NOCA|nr:MULTISPECIES: thiamine pyrophosphate-binding protein [Nocardia]MCM6777489.1 thiamine pyrophosphate-binding protein [Nocardia pulmonis]MCM6790404.1 thiamine pyrophosphate-binding protein [Nocardia sp. CDC159]
MPSRTVDYLVRAVAELGVRHVFGVDGANIEDLYDALFDAPNVTGVVAKHEFSAAAMADGYARSTAGLGVVAATSGGGAMNLVAGLAESFASRVPVLALVGQAPTGLAGKGAFQDSSGLAGTFDAARLFDQISYYCTRVTHAADLPAQLDRAVRAALRGGPAVLLLPKDVQEAVIAAESFRPPRPEFRSDTAGLARVRAELRAARACGKITIIAGDQVARDDARAQLCRLAAVLEAAVGVAPDAKDVYDHDEPGFCGVAGSMGHPELVDAVRGSALCLLIGTRLPITARTGLDEALTHPVLAGIGAERPYPDGQYAMTTDLAVTLAALADDLGADHPGPAAPPRPLTPLPVPAADGPGLRYRDIVEILNAALEPGTDVFADAGNTGAAVVHHLRLPRGGRFVVALGMGGMGYAFGAGIGSAFARRHRPGGGMRRTFVIAGDGAFYMHGMEIHTALEYELPVTFVVCNNNAHAMCVTREQLYYGDRYSFNRFRPAHPGAGVAAMFPELPAYSPGGAGELAAVVQRCIEDTGPSFISIDCDPDEIPPFIPFLSAPRRHS